MFAVITPALMTGAFADRLRFLPYLVFISLWIITVYCPFCHWVWGGGWMGSWGVKDFAGGIVVHISSGFSALASLAVLGKRPELSCHEIDISQISFQFSIKKNKFKTKGPGGSILHARRRRSAL